VELACRVVVEQHGDGLSLAQATWIVELAQRAHRTVDLLGVDALAQQHGHERIARLHREAIGGVARRRLLLDVDRGVIGGSEILIGTDIPLIRLDPGERGLLSRGGRRRVIDHRVGTIALPADHDRAAGWRHQRQTFERLHALRALGISEL